MNTTVICNESSCGRAYFRYVSTRFCPWCGHEAQHSTPQATDQDAVAAEMRAAYARYLRALPRLAEVRAPQLYSATRYCEASHA